jgi:hypothetical protein
LGCLLSGCGAVPQGERRGISIILGISIMV